MINLTQTLPQSLTEAGFILYERGRRIYLYRNQDHQGCIFIAKLPVRATVLNVAEVAEHHLKLKIGEIRRAVEMEKIKNPLKNISFMLELPINGG